MSYHGLTDTGSTERKRVVLLLTRVSAFLRFAKGKKLGRNGRRGRPNILQSQREKEQKDDHQKSIAK